MTTTKTTLVFVVTTFVTFRAQAVLPDQLNTFVAHPVGITSMVPQEPLLGVDIAQLAALAITDIVMHGTRATSSHRVVGVGLFNCVLAGVLAIYAMVRKERPTLIRVWGTQPQPRG